MGLGRRRVNTIQWAIEQGGTVDEAGQRWAAYIVRAARLARAVTARQGVKYLAARGLATTVMAIRRAGEKGRFWSTKGRVPGQRKEARVYDPKDLLIYCRNVREDANYYRPSGRRR